MLMWTRRQAGVLERSRVFCYFAFALAILTLWVTSTLAEPLILRVVEATPRADQLNPNKSFIVVRFDDDGRKALAQFTAEHRGEFVDWLIAGRRERIRINDPILGGIINMMSYRNDEVVEIANHIATEGRIELNAIGPPRQ